MGLLCLAILTSIVAGLGHCGTYTVTGEVWFDIRIKDMDGRGRDYLGRFVVAVFGETVPMTALNFMSLARGYQRPSGLLTYAGSKVHRIIPDFVVQLGDITRGDGTGGRSIYGKTFHDENFQLHHRDAGWVAMANHGPDTNSSQFYILLQKARWLDGDHVVFGKVIRGFEVLRRLSQVPTGSEGHPLLQVNVERCGVLGPARHYDLPANMLDSTTEVHIS